MGKTDSKEASFWHKERNDVRCDLCSWKCFIPKNKLGYCQVRKNTGGKLYSLNYGKVASYRLANIEKNPLFHFYPGTRTFFIETAGSSLRPSFRNFPKTGREIGINKMNSEISRSGAKSVTFGGGDPVVEMEYVLELMKANKKNGVANVIVTGGYINNEVTKKINKFIDAVTLEVYASLDSQFYKSYLSVEDTKPIYIFMKQMKKHGVHMEIANFTIHQLGDGMGEFKEFVGFLSSDINTYTPLHLVQFKPEGKLANLPKISHSVLEKFHEKARDYGLRHVFLHGVAGKEDTICYNCNQILIKRRNASITSMNMEGDRCPSCGLRISITVES